MGKSYRSEKYFGDGFGRKGNGKAKRSNQQQSFSRDKANRQYEVQAHMSQNFTQNEDNDSFSDDDC